MLKVNDILEDSRAMSRSCRRYYGHISDSGEIYAVKPYLYRESSAVVVTSYNKRGLSMYNLSTNAELITGTRPGYYWDDVYKKLIKWKSYYSNQHLAGISEVSARYFGGSPSISDELHNFHLIYCVFNTVFPVRYLRTYIVSPNWYSRDNGRTYRSFYREGAFLEKDIVEFLHEESILWNNLQSYEVTY